MKTTVPPGMISRVSQVVAIGLASGLGFVLPIGAMLLTQPGQARTASLLAAMMAAVLLVRLLGRRLHRLLDRTERQMRFPLLALYGVAAMLPPVSLLSLPHGPH